MPIAWETIYREVHCCGVRDERDFGRVECGIVFVIWVGILTSYTVAVLWPTQEETPLGDHVGWAQPMATDDDG